MTASIRQYDVDTRTTTAPIQMLLKHHTRSSDVARVRRSCIKFHIDDGMPTLPGLQKLGGQCGDCISGRLCHVCLAFVRFDISSESQCKVANSGISHFSLQLCTISLATSLHERSVDCGVRRGHFRDVAARFLDQGLPVRMLLCRRHRHPGGQSDELRTFDDVMWNENC